MEFSYKRVSTLQQNTDRQLIGIKCDREFIEKVSASNSDRPVLESLLGVLREGDVVHVHELSRLARNTKDLLQIVEEVLSSGANIIFHKENLHFKSDEKKSPVQNLMLSMLASIAQFERELLLERQKEGIALAKQKGVYKGRKSRFSKKDIDQIKIDFKNARNKSELARKLKITRAYLYRIVNT